MTPDHHTHLSRSSRIIEPRTTTSPSAHLFLPTLRLLADGRQMPLVELIAAITSMHTKIVDSGAAVPVSGLSAGARAKNTVHELRFIEAIAYQRPDMYSIDAVGMNLLRDAAADLIPVTVDQMYEARKDAVRATLAKASAERAERKRNQPAAPAATPSPVPSAAERPSILSAGQPKPTKGRDGDGGFFRNLPDLGDVLGELLEGVFDGF